MFRWPGSRGGLRRSRTFAGWRRTSRGRPWSTATSTWTCSPTSTWWRKPSVTRFHGAPRRTRGASSQRGGTDDDLAVTHMTPTEQLRQELYAAFKNRALLYRQFFDELRREHGDTRAADIMGRAIYARGVEIGKSFSRYAPADLSGLRDAFLAFVPDEGRMFDPLVTRCDAGGLDIALRRCPRKEAWAGAGVPGREGPGGGP